MKPFAPKILLLIAIAVRPTLAAAQDFGFEPPESATDPALPAALRDLAERVLPVYQEDDPDRYLANLAALQMAVGDPAAAHATRLSLQERLQSEQGGSAGPVAPWFTTSTRKRGRPKSERGAFAFPSAYCQAFRDTLNGFDDLDAYELEDWFITPIEPLREDLQRALDQRRGKSSIALEEALDLVRAWFAFDAYRQFRRHSHDRSSQKRTKGATSSKRVAIPVSKDATLAATLVHPRSGARAGALPTLLEFTLDRSSRDAREAAAHGYASVLALARIAGDPQFRPRAPFESDGDDARAVIEWIATQSVERRPRRHAGQWLRRLRRVVGGEATAGCVEGDRDVRPNGARHRRADVPTGSS